MSNVRERLAQTPDQLSALDHCTLYAGAVLGQTWDTLRNHLPSRGKVMAVGIAAVEAIVPLSVGAEAASAQNADAAGVKTANGLYFKSLFSPAAMSRSKANTNNSTAGSIGVNGNLDGRHPMSVAEKNRRLPGISLKVKRLPINGATHQRFYLNYPKKFKIHDIAEQNVDHSVTFMGEALKKKVKKTKNGYSLVWTDPNVWGNVDDTYTSSLVAYFDKRK